MNDSDLKTGNHLSPSPKGEDVRDQQMFTHTHTHTHTQSESVTKKWQNYTSSREGAEREGQQMLAHTHTHTHTELLTDSERKFNKAPL